MKSSRSSVKKSKKTKKKAAGKTKKSVHAAPKVRHTASKTQHSTGGPLPKRHPAAAERFTPQIGLPPNEKLQQFADEIYGAMELPQRKHDK
jgi:hypothetical protein